MVHLDTQEAAVAESEVETTDAENSEVEATEPNEDDVAPDYPDDEPQQPEMVDDGEEGENTDEGEEPETDIIAPVSFNEEERAAFGELPNEVREFVSSAIQRRDLDTQQGVEKLKASESAALQKASETVANTQQDYAQRFEAFAEAFAPKPPDQSQYSDVGSYLLAKEQYRDERAEFDQIKAQIDGIKGEAQGHYQEQDQQWRSEQIKELMNIPEFAAPETRTEFLTGIEAFGIENGYSKEELAQAGAKDIQFVKSAMTDRADAEKWRDHVKKRNQRPRQAGRFTKTAPAGGTAPAQPQADPLALQYPDD